MHAETCNTCVFDMSRISILQGYTPLDGIQCYISRLSHINLVVDRTILTAVCRILLPDYPCQDPGAHKNTPKIPPVFDVRQKMRFDKQRLSDAKCFVITRKIQYRKK